MIKKLKTLIKLKIQFKKWSVIKMNIYLQRVKTIQ